MHVVQELPHYLQRRVRRCQLQERGALVTDTSDEFDVPRDLIERALRTSEAFLVDSESGSDAGVVERVIFDEAGHVTGIEVAVGWFGRKRWTFAVTDVVTVLPTLRRLVISDSSAARMRTSSP